MDPEDTVPGQEIDLGGHTGVVLDPVTIGTTPATLSHTVICSTGAGGVQLRQLQINKGSFQLQRPHLIPSPQLVPAKNHAPQAWGVLGQVRG